MGLERSRTSCGIQEIHSEERRSLGEDVHQSINQMGAKNPEEHPQTMYQHQLLIDLGHRAS